MKPLMALQRILATKRAFTVIAGERPVSGVCLPQLVEDLHDVACIKGSGLAYGSVRASDFDVSRTPTKSC